MRVRGMAAALTALLTLLALLPAAPRPAEAERAAADPLHAYAHAHAAGPAPLDAAAPLPLCGTHLITESAAAALSAVPFRRLSVEELRTLRQPGPDGWATQDTLNQTTQLWADNLERGGQYQVTATLKRVTPHGYVYVDNAVTVSDAALDSIAAAWESIYEKNTGLFGEPPDVDGDPHITILLLDILDGFSGKGGYVAGYFNATNELPTAFSNLREMFYLDTNPGKAGDQTSLYTLAHEFHHMINYNYHKAAGGQETWLNEGLAEFAGFHAGYGHTPNIVPFLRDPSNSLIQWGDEARSYGSSYLFMLYLWERYGGDALIREIAQNPGLSVDAVDAVLAARGAPDRFRQIFSKWTVANYLGDPVSAGGAYGYQNLRLADALTQGDPANNKTVFRRPPLTNSFAAYPVSSSGTVNGWAARYYQFSGSAEALTLAFSGSLGAAFGVNVAAGTAEGYPSGTNTVSVMPLKEAASGSLTVPGLGAAARTVLLIPSAQPAVINAPVSAAFQFTGALTGAAAPSPTPAPSVTPGPSATPPASPSPSVTPSVTPSPTPAAAPLAVALTVPANGAALPGLGAQLSWTLPARTTQYQLQVTPANNDGPAINLIRNAEPGYLIPAPQFGRGDYLMLPGMTYTWRVRASSKAGSAPEGDPSWGPWSARTFRTPAPNAASLTLTNPPDGAAVGVEPVTLQWRDASAAVFYYEVQMSADPQFRTDPAAAVAPVYWNMVHGGVTAPLNSWVTPALQPGAAYYWRVRPRVQGDGVPVAWSAPRRFTAGPQPAAITAISPITFGAGLANVPGCVVSAAAAAFAAGAPQVAVRLDAAGQGGLALRWSQGGAVIQVDDRSVAAPGGCVAAVLTGQGGLRAGRYQMDVLAGGKLLGSGVFTVGPAASLRVPSESGGADASEGLPMSNGQG